MNTPANSTDKVSIKRIIHTIHATSDIEACRAKYLDIFGGVIFAEGYYEAEDRDMALLYVVNHMIEPMSPRNPENLEKPFARYLKKHGQCFQSFELKVENGPQAAAKFKAEGCKLASDYGQFFFVRDTSTGGVLLEVCELPMPNDPYERNNWNPNVLTGHPSGLLELDHIACVVTDLQPVLHFFTEICDGKLLSDEKIEHPEPAHRILLRLGDTRVAFTQPEGPGALTDFLAPPSSGIYSLVWRVVSEKDAEAFFHKQKIRTLREDCISGGFAIHPDDFLGARHEFVER